MLQMEQKDYRFEIIGILLKGEDHVRSIAKRLKTNHMMISRKMKELLKMNIVDLKTNGRNQTYFVKTSVEAKTFILMTENYKLIKVIHKYPLLRDVVNKIKDDKRIKLALIFGSYAKNLANKKSDIDIFIETKNKKIKNEYSALDSKLRIKIGKFNRKENMFKEMDKNHLLIKGGEIFYEKFFD